MDKPFIVITGIYDFNTSEQTILKETQVFAKDQYEAHKKCFFQCDLLNGQTVLKILDYNSKRVLFDHLKGFFN